MSPLVYKAWIVDKNIMVNVCSIDIQQKFIRYVHPTTLQYESSPFDKNVRLQSTGYWDDDGNELFDGDIIQYLPLSEDNCISVIFWDQMNCCWSLRHISIYGDVEPLKEYQAREIQFIGNKYTHPELLNAI